MATTTPESLTADPPFHLVTWLDHKLFRPPDSDRTALRNPVSTVAPDEVTLRVPRDGGVLVFDGYCGFCTRAVLAILRRDRLSRVRALPLQGRDVLRVTRLSREEALRAAWWIDADHIRRTGAGAMVAALSAATGQPVLTVYRFPPVRRLADRVYHWVATHRRLLRGIAPHCEASSDANCDSYPGDAIHPDH